MRVAKNEVSNDDFRTTRTIRQVTSLSSFLTLFSVGCTGVYFFVTGY